MYIKLSLSNLKHFLHTLYMYMYIEVGTHSEKLRSQQTGECECVTTFFRELQCPHLLSQLIIPLVTCQEHSLSSEGEGEVEKRRDGGEKSSKYGQRRMSHGKEREVSGEGGEWRGR